MPIRLRCEDYTVGWVCALSVELAAAQEMLDEEHQAPDIQSHDTNIYTCGRIGEHNVVIACLPEGQMGTTSAARVAVQMKSAYTSIRFGLMVGIGGGVPSETDIRLGDVVVSKPQDVHGGVVQYDSGKATTSGFQRTGFLDKPPAILLNAITNIKAKHMRGIFKFLDYLLAFVDRLPEFGPPVAGPDILFEAAYKHNGGKTCSNCDDNYSISREPRRQDVVVHYGTIASGNQVIKDAHIRDKLSSELGDILCFEMEAAGLMDCFPCLVIRGICDYADSHKNKGWQPYAAATAAAYAKEIVSIIPAADVVKARAIEEITREAKKHNSEPPANPHAKRRKSCCSDDIDENISSVTNQQTITLTDRAKAQTVSKVLTSDENDCLRSLYFPEQEHRYDDIYTAQGTCDWLLQDPQYRAWKEGKCGLFWIKGNPGTGKSVLTKYALKKMKEEMPEGLVFSFFIHGQGSDLQKTPLGIFRALLNSVLYYFPESLAELTMKFQDREKRFGGYAAGRWKWLDRELQELLFAILTKGTKDRSVVIFIDALDECGESTAKSLLIFFKDVVKQAEREGGQVSICLSSRHYPIISLEDIPSTFAEEHNGMDIQWYTRERLKDIWPKKKRLTIENEILSKARGGFQWIFLVTEMVIGRSLSGARTDGILKELGTCPETLNELYDAILSDTDASDKRQMIKLFQWVLFAERPLSAQELREAFVTDKDMVHTTIAMLRQHDSWSDTLADFERHVTHLSRGLIEFQTREIWEQYEPNGEDWDREAQLIHQSVADYLLEKFLNTAECSQHGRVSEIGAGHFQISRSCLRYLMLKEVLDGASLSRGIVSSKYPLAPYAARFLFEHIHKVEREGVPQTDLLSIINWQPNSSALERLAKLLKVLDPESAHIPLGWPFIGATALHVLASFGSKTGFDIALEKSEREVYGKDSDGNTPLIVAIREGHQDIALGLLDWLLKNQTLNEDGYEDDPGDSNDNGNRETHVPDIDAENVDGDTALTVALTERAEDVIFKLIDAGTDLNHPRHETAALLFALSNTNMRLLKIMIDRGVNLNGAVFFAVKDYLRQEDERLLDLISELLKAGANTVSSPLFTRAPSVDDESEYEENHIEETESLMIASRRGFTDVIELLLSHDRELAMYQDQNLDCPLLVATRYGHINAVEILLQVAPEAVGLQNLDGETAILEACKSDHYIFEDEILALLIEEGDFSEEPKILETALSYAATFELLELIVTIIEKMNDAIVNVKDLRTPIDINFDVRTSKKRTPLSVASECGRSGLVELLLGLPGVDADARDVDGLTPLLWATKSGEKDVVKVLLDSGRVNVNAEGLNGQTPLLYAAEDGNEEITELLCQVKELNVEHKGQRGKTALFLAAEEGHVGVIRLLLNEGRSDINYKDSVGRTVLSYAAASGFKELVQLLLDRNADVNSLDRNGWSPLMYAAGNGRKIVVELLLSMSKVDTNGRDHNDHTILSWAAHHGNKPMLTLLLKTGKLDVNSKGAFERTPLGWAAFGGHEEIVESLLGVNEININATDEFGQTALFLAFYNGHKKIVKLLLQRVDVDADARGGTSQTPLSWAVERGREDMVRLLLASGKVHVDRKDIHGRTPLWVAVRTGNISIAKILLDTGKVDLDSENNFGLSLSSLAKRMGDTFARLLQSYEQAA